MRRAWQAALETTDAHHAARLSLSDRRHRAARFQARAAAALGPLADAGERFNASDVILPDGAPQRRFVHAEGLGCTLSVDYEQGGRGQHLATARFTYVNGGWTLTSPGR